MSLIDSETRREVGKTDLAAARPRSDTRAGSPRQAGDRFKAGALVMGRERVVGARFQRTRPQVVGCSRIPAEACYPSKRPKHTNSRPNRWSKTLIIDHRTLRTRRGLLYVALFALCPFTNGVAQSPPVLGYAAAKNANHRWG